MNFVLQRLMRGPTLAVKRQLVKVSEVQQPSFGVIHDSEGNYKASHRNIGNNMLIQSLVKHSQNVCMKILKCMFW